MRLLHLFISYWFCFFFFFGSPLCGDRFHFPFMFLIYFPLRFRRGFFLLAFILSFFMSFVVLEMKVCNSILKDWVSAKHLDGAMIARKENKSEQHKNWFHSNVFDGKIFMCGKFLFSLFSLYITNVNGSFSLELKGKKTKWFKWKGNWWPTRGIKY